MAPTPFESAVNWIRRGYPDGVPPQDFPPLLALLTRVLDEEDATIIALTVAREHGDPQRPVTEQQIHDAIKREINEPPNSEEVNQVASRLAAAGWPLAGRAPQTANSQTGT